MVGPKFRFFQNVNFDTWETLPPNKMNFPSNSDTNIVFIASEKLKKLDSKNIQTQDSILFSIGFKESLDSFWSKDKSMKASDFINQEGRLKAAVASNNLMEYTVLQDSTFLPYYLNYFIGQIENVKSIEKFQIGEVTEGVVYFRERKPLPFAEGLRYFISQREDYLLKNKKN